MVRRCQLCGRNEFLHSNVSFHKLPSDAMRKKEWFTILGLDISALPQNVYVCQDNFLEKDFMVNKIGSRYLRPGSKPVRRCVDPKEPNAKPASLTMQTPSNVTFGGIQEQQAGPSRIQISYDSDAIPSRSTRKSLEKEPSESDKESMLDTSMGMLQVTANTKTTTISEIVSWALNLQWCHSKVCEEGILESSQKFTDSAQYIRVTCNKCPYSKDRLLPVDGTDTNIETLPSDESQEFENIPSSSSVSQGQMKKPVSSETSSSTKSASETEQYLFELVSNIMTDTNLGPNVVGPASGFKGTLGLLNVPLKRKRKYVGDLSSEDFGTPRKAKRNFRLMKKTVVKQRSQIKRLQVTAKRMRQRTNTLTDLLKLLKQKSYVSETAENALLGSLSGTSEALFERMLKGPSKQRYDPAVRSFALTLSFYSPRAYNYVRSTFNRTLPHLATISKWLVTVDGTPGFTKEALTALQLKSSEAAASGKHILCNLVFDEMAIRKQVEWTGNKFTGHVDIGAKFSGDIIPAAKEALVFMLVALNSSWKIPVGYFLLDGLPATEKGELVRKCLQFVDETGVTVTSITCDGTPTNIAMMKSLGANFDNPKDLRTYFLHPTTNDRVFIFLDPCHMLKIVRNCFGSAQILKYGNDLIEWRFLDKLVNLQDTEGLHAATKIRARHLQWVREKMKVKLAAQVLSRSVSDALLYLGNDLKLSEFANVGPTAIFIRKFNDLFDIFNSRNRFATYVYKRPLSLATAESFFTYLDEMITYICSLSLEDTPILNSSRKTGFLGFLVCIESLKSMYETYINDKEALKYILTYNFSQDHLELFFESIRSKGGYNNNPTARQFEAAYKRLIVHSEIAGPSSGNVQNLEYIPVLTCSSSHPITRNYLGLDNLQSDEYNNFDHFVKNEITQFNSASPTWHLTEYATDIVSYIAGFVVKSLHRCVSCVKCLVVLQGDEVDSHLQKRKSFGALKIASRFVITICRTAERFFSHFQKTNSIFNPQIKNLLCFLITSIVKLLPPSIYDCFGEHLYEEDPIDGHSSNLVKLILKIYFNLRIHHEATKIQSKEVRVRSLLTKTITFKGQ